MKITVEQLGQILFEEFERDGWGLADTYYFNKPDSGDGMQEVLERVVARLNVTKD